VIGFRNIILRAVSTNNGLTELPHICKVRASLGWRVIGRAASQAFCHSASASKQSESNLVLSAGVRRWAPACPLVLALVASLVTVSVYSSTPSAPLFPKALHLTRSIEEPLTGAKSTVDEYYFGNRVITVRGDRTVIVDYDKRTITEIDRAKATYAVTSFDDVANARPHRAIPRATAKTAQTQAQSPSMERLRSDQRAGRGVEIFSGDDRVAALHAEIAVDNTLSLSRDAFDVIIGSAYPNDGGPANDLARGAAKRTAGATETYGLPMEQTLRWTVGTATVETKNLVTRVGEEGAPPDLIAIPPGAKEVDSRLLRAKKLGDEVDSLPTIPAARH
jgi:hypothetical protein